VFGSPGVFSTNGSTLTTAKFSATAGELIDFEFNYITSDGSGYPDYGWAALMSTDGGTDYLIFSAQTQPYADTVPGFTMPPLAPGTSLSPPASPIMLGTGAYGGPVWAELGFYSGKCWALGCGLTGWITSEFTGEAPDTYVLEFGVSNANDIYYDTGLAFAGVEVGGTPVATTPEPSSVALLGTGLLGLIGIGLRKKRLA
jgi:hypothetical protein